MKKSLEELAGSLKRDKERLGLIHTILTQMENKQGDFSLNVIELIQNHRSLLNHLNTEAHIVSNGHQKLWLDVRKFIKDENVNYSMTYNCDDAVVELTTPHMETMNEGIMSKFKQKFDFDVSIIEEDDRNPRFIYQIYQA